MTTPETAALDAEYGPRIKYDCAALGCKWEHTGGCNCGCHEYARCSVPVHECSECGDCDYGDNEEANEKRKRCRLNRAGRSYEVHHACERPRDVGDRGVFRRGGEVQGPMGLARVAGRGGLPKRRSAPSHAGRGRAPTETDPAGPEHAVNPIPNPNPDPEPSHE